MKTILLLGAGRSSGALIRYLLENAAHHHFQLTVAEKDIQLAESKIAGHENGHAISFDIEDEKRRNEEIEKSSLVISLLPPHLHILAAKDCLKFGKHLLTASYLSPELLQMDSEAKEKGLLFLCECGLDPGIDHMSAMDIIHRIKAEGGQLRSFRSYTGGLIAPESIDNPWGYKFTWNPRNVILAGQSTARYIQDGKYHYIPYPRLFSESVRITVPGHGKFDGYANRDSLSYRKHYEIDEIPTLIRGTLRQEGFCSAWQVFVTLGLTDDTFEIEKPGELTYRSFTESFIPPTVMGQDTEERIARFCSIDPDGPSMERIRSTGILEEKKIPLTKGTPAQILQNLLESKWILKTDDKDMIVMQHVFEYDTNGKNKQLTSTLVVKGENQQSTAMAMTVGLPLGICALKVLNGEIRISGVRLPVLPEIYKPILNELSEMGISFQETTT